MKDGVSRFPLPSQLFLTANEKDFSLSLEMTIRGKGFAIGKGGEWLPQWFEKECEMYLSRFVIPSAAEGSFSFPVSVFLRKAVCMKHRTPKSHEACFPFPALLTASPNRKRKRFLAFARNDDAGKGFAIGKAAFSLLPPEGGTLKGRRLASAAGLKKNGGCASPVSSSRAQPRDLFRFPFPFSFVKPSA